ARKGGLVDDRIVDRIAASLRIQLDVGTMDEGREVKFAAPLYGARAILAVDHRGLGDELRIGHDEHRPRDDLRSAPPGGDRRLGGMRLGLAVVDQRVDHEQRYPENERHETDEKQLDTGTSVRHDTAPSAMSRVRRATNRLAVNQATRSPICFSAGPEIAHGTLTLPSHLRRRNRPRSSSAGDTDLHRTP